MNITIKSFNGIGDLLFVTPTLRRIKESYPFSFVTVNTNYPDLLEGNPFVDRIGTEREGVFLGYPDPIYCKPPERHHIESDWLIVCKHYDLQLKPPELKPEIYIDLPCERDKVGVQVMHKGQWFNKKVWPYFKELSEFYEPIPKMPNAAELARKIAGYELVVCSEGGVSHLAKAVGTKAIVLFGGWSNPKWNGYKDQINVTNKVECSYCYDNYPCRDDYKCWKQIKLETVRNLISEAVVCSGTATSTSMR